jgi:acid phosphatase type 7
VFKIKGLRVFSSMKKVFFASMAFVFSLQAMPGALVAQSVSASAGRPCDTIVVYGDTRNGHEVHRKLISRMLRIRPCAVFHTGDLVFDGKNEKNWDVFNEIVAELVQMAPLYAAYGNHERGRINIKQPAPVSDNTHWYSAHLNGIHFIVLDFCSRYTPGSEQYSWLIRELENRAAATKFTIVIAHFPMYTSGPHRTQLKKLRNTFVPVFKKYGVDLVFGGHNHGYERLWSDGTYYVVTAGGGAPLYRNRFKETRSQIFVRKHHFCLLSVRNDTLFITAKDTALRMIDAFSISAK